MTQVRWLAPSPLWDDLVGKPAGFRAPALLRFSGDDFIPQLQGVLEREPARLRAFVARPESWREPAAGLDAPVNPRFPLRLYQPVHGRFYLAAASLACRVPGLPEHTVDAAAGEAVAFVVRRITVAVDAQSGAETETGEWAWVRRADGGEGWVSAAGQALVADEEQLPMFGAAFAGRGAGKAAVQRRVFAGLVPASRREAYVGGRELAAAQAPPPPGSLDDARVIEFQRAVLDPWVEMKGWYDGERYDDDRRASALDSVERNSALILLDLHDFLRDRLEPVWKVIDGTQPRSTLGAGAYGVLYDALAAVHASDRAAARSAPLVAALSHAAAFRDRIEALTFPGYPAYVPRVLIGDPRRYTNPPPQTPVPDGGGPSTPEEGEQRQLLARLAAPRELDDPPVGVRNLKKLVMDALAAAGAGLPALPEQLPARRAAAAGDDWFAVRCVYLRPQCGRRSPPLVSDRSERFRLVSFFEPDAPARHLRVALPVDTSPATLRKYNNNVAFVLSDQLRKQMSRAASLKGLMDGEVGEEGGGLDFAVICSFSIPIITICALILLMIIVSLLNIIFWWIPLFKICFPMPKPRG